MKQNRRQLLKNIGISGGVLGSVYLFSTQNKSEGALAGGNVETSLRFTKYNPLSGGIALRNDDLYGSIGIGVVYNSSKRYILTNRHVIDDNFCEGSAEELEGEVIKQLDKREIGKVHSASETGGIESNDWALIQLDNPDLWTNSVVGFNQIGSIPSYSKGDRIVMGGYQTGLIGGKITETDLTVKYEGCLIGNLIEYEIDGDRYTGGNSGTIVGKVDSENKLRPIGLHSFTDTENQYGYAVALDEVLQDCNAELDTSTITKGKHEIQDYEFEGTMCNFDSSNNTGTFLISNIGAVGASTIVRTLDEDMNVLQTEDLTISKYSSRFVEMEFTKNGYLEYADNTIPITI